MMLILTCLMLIFTCLILILICVSLIITYIILFFAWWTLIPLRFPDVHLLDPHVTYLILILP
jgi:hypothetical protein